MLESILRVVKEEVAAGAAVFKQKWECWEGREERGRSRRQGAGQEAGCTELSCYLACSTYLLGF